MKKLLLIFTFLISLVLPANADIIPCYVKSINPNSIGVYQAENSINVYKEPNVNSKLLFNAKWDSTTYDCPTVSASNLFSIYLPRKNLAFLTVLDENDNEDWMQISYLQNGEHTGWVIKNDELKFMSWRNFFNLYGRKYGLYYLKDAPEASKIVYGSADEASKSIAQVTLPQNIKLMGVSGNWFLIRALDIDRIEKIGWIKWRNVSGEIYLFPDIK